MGTGGTPAPWAPILAFVSHSLPTSQACCATMLLANRGVGLPCALHSSYISTIRSVAQNLLALHPNTKPKGSAVIDVQGGYSVC